MSKSEKRRQSKINKRNHRKKNRNNIKRDLGVRTRDVTPTHRFGVEPSVPKTSEELREMNEIKSEEDLYKNIYFLDWTYKGQTIWDDEKGEPIPNGFGKETFTKNVTPIVSAVTDGEEKEVSYEGGFKNGERDGYGLIIVNSGSTYEGHFVNGQKHGKGFTNYRTANNFIHSGKDLVECRFEYSNGVSIGMMEYIYEDGASTSMDAEIMNHRISEYKTLSKEQQLNWESYSTSCVS